MNRHPSIPAPTAPTTLLALAAIAQACAAQTASQTFTVNDFTVDTRINSGQVATAIDTSAVDFSDPFIAYRITADWQQIAPIGETGAFSIDYVTAFGDRSTLQLISSIEFARNGAGPEPVQGLTYTGSFNGPFTGLPSTDLVVSAFFGNGASRFSNVTVEWFTQSDIPQTTFRPGQRSANAPQTFVDLGAVAAVGEPITIDTFGSEYDSEIAVYAADGTLIATNDDAPIGGRQSFLTLESGLIFNPDGTIDFRTFGAGEYFIAVSDFDTQFFEDFDLFLDPFTNGGNLFLNINGVEVAASTFVPYEVQYFRFTIVPAPPTLALGLAAAAGLARRRRR